MLKPMRGAKKKDENKNVGKQFKKLPVIQPIHMGNKKYSSLHSTHCKSGSTLKERMPNTKHSRTESLSQAIQQANIRNSLKMQQSIMRFTEKQNIYRRTHLQKRKQKKVYSIDSSRGEQAQFMKTFNHKTVKKIKQVSQKVFQQPFNRQYQFQNLPNVCYDSQFTYQREGSCLTLLNNKLYLFGGALRRKFYYTSNSKQNNNIDVLFHSYDDDRWVRQQINGELDVEKKNLIYHTINTISKKLIVIVGGLLGDSQKTLSKFNKSMLIYNIESKKFQESSLNFSMRSHSSVAFDNYVVVHGGVDELGNIRSDMFAILINNSKDSTPRICRIETNEALVHHQMITTLGEEKGFRINLRENNGIYLFGGETNSGKMDNDLKILKIYSSTQLDKKSIKKFQTLTTFGAGPCARKNHSMNLVPSKNIIVIIGGLDIKTNFLSDAWLIDLSQLRWIRVQTEPSIDMFLGGICKHATVSNSTSIFIMGGHHLNDVGSSNLWRLDFHEEKKTRQRKMSEVSKVSSLWSIKNSNNPFGSYDKIIFND